MAKARDVRSKLLELLAENPSISAACRKLSINRMMFYRLKKSDADFKRNVKLAMIDGRTKWVEIAELGLMSLVKEINLGAIKFRCLRPKNFVRIYLIAEEDATGVVALNGAGELPSWVS